ncbi:FxsA family protein [Aquamicrobium sp. LC103]|uniref:FxsA family protein n=1 Tax=Aquamicrobium sp. LC103 TaxID=1120658 RepID=UPI00063EA4A5|nr:FxsA family protein [Aquamicrobium sp. LC103]TKT82800.1 membrane protein FxsA [Aquamicrobium sp. LC103]
MRPSILPFLLLAFPLVEIAGFVVVGGWIGVLPTIALVIATTIAGGLLLRIQGFGALTRIRASLEQGGDPGRELVNALMIMMAGVLLLLPGFVTDILGILLFIPWIRNLAWIFIGRHIVVIAPDFRSGARPNYGRDGRTIDLDSDEYSQESKPDSHRPSLDDKR